ncbi:glycosyltransferase [Methanobacterium petrolearium]|uniref:glycosyltransferase n=1 Tax=Methanobacterium petrolearium TaxID=710190 RepID=UPI001AE62C4B|nr:glycosyltransferase [Methanobacterium petrolearium]MBP1945474.1 glycosyltransferase involved in cell wall biosynthesis [Methanobacterium petrolearium]BDZ71680.1 hypothetical protein GCM10025861_21970 [Methanobacterium petrolearium]
MKIIITSVVDLKKSQHNRPHQFVKYLSKNHDVSVLSVNDWWKGEQGDLELYSSGFDDIFYKIDYHYLTDRKVMPFLQELLFTKKIKELSKEDFDVHFNYNSLITGYRMSKYFKTVFDLADDLPGMIRKSPQIPRFLRPIGGLMGDYYLKKCIRISEAVTLTTPELRNNNHIQKQKVNIIPNGVDTQEFSYYKNFKKELGLDGFIIGYVGVLREWVDFKPVFKAIKFLDPEIKLLIVGREGRFKETKELAVKCGVSDRVIFAGMIPYSQVPKYISAMDVGIIPFHLDGIAHNALPIKLFEYMACEKPVISTKLDSLTNQFLEDILYVSDENDYANMIKLLYENHNLARKLGKNGRRIVKLNYNWEMQTKRLENILERLL